MRRAVVLAGAVVAVAAAAWACAEGLGPGGRGRVRLAIVAVFSEAAPELLSGDLDRLRIRISRVPSGTVVRDTTVAVDSSGNVELNLAVPLTAETETFEVLLEGIRSSDGMVLYTGVTTVAVSSTGTPAPAEVPVSYVGPCQTGAGCTVTVGPQGTVLNQGDSVVMTAAVDSAGRPVAGVPVSLANLAPTLILVRSNRTIVARTGTPGGPAAVEARTRDDADTLRLFVPGPGVQPATVVATPGYAGLRIGATTQLSDTVKDAVGNVLGVGISAWTSRTPAVATVSAGGLVTGVSRGRAVLVAATGPASDSIYVTVGDGSGAGDPIAVALTNGRSFGARRVGDSVFVDVVVSHAAVPSDSIGSYNARFTWNTAAMRFAATGAAPAPARNFPLPTINSDSTAAGILRFAAADPNGLRGEVTLLRLKFVALAAAPTSPALTFSDMSAARTFTNMLPRLLVTEGAATIRP